MLKLCLSFVYVFLSIYSIFYIYGVYYMLYALFDYVLRRLAFEFARFVVFAAHSKSSASCMHSGLTLTLCSTR